MLLLIENGSDYFHKFAQCPDKVWLNLLTPSQSPANPIYPATRFSSPRIISKKLISNCVGSKKIVYDTRSEII